MDHAYLSCQENLFFYCLVRFQKSSSSAVGKLHALITSDTTLTKGQVRKKVSRFSLLKPGAFQIEIVSHILISCQFSSVLLTVK